MKFSVLTYFFLSASMAFAGNGSSGVGNGPIAVVGNIEASSLFGRVGIRDHLIVDLETSGRLAELSDVKPTEINRLLKEENLVTAMLGSVTGFEKLSDKNGKDSYWIVCAEESCKKILPLSTSNPLIPGVIGTLRKRGTGQK